MCCEDGIFVFKPETPLHGIISRSYFRSANRTKCHQNCFFTQRSQSELGSTPKQKTRNISLDSYVIYRLRIQLDALYNRYTIKLAFETTYVPIPDFNTWP